MSRLNVANRHGSQRRPDVKAQQVSVKPHGRGLEPSGAGIEVVLAEFGNGPRGAVCKYTQTPAPDEQANPRSRRGLVGAGAVRSRALLGGAEQGAEFTEPVALAVDVNDRDVMQ